MTGPTSGTFTVGQSVPIQWTAGNVAAGSTIALCYDTGTSFGNATWITFGQAGANGNGTYNWNTTGVAAGHVLHRRLSLLGRHAVLLPPDPVDHHPGRRPRANVHPDGPDLRHVHRRPGGSDPVDRRQRGRRQHRQPLLDTDTAWNGNETWIKYGVAAANGTGSYSWNTTGVAPGTYYIGGYLYSGGSPVYSHLTQSITIQSPAAGTPTFSLTGPTSGTFAARPVGSDPVDGRQCGRGQHDRPVLRHRHFV